LRPKEGEEGFLVREIQSLNSMKGVSTEDLVECWNLERHGDVPAGMKPSRG
jgi:hypothetical protein